MPRPGRETLLQEIRNGRPSAVTDELIVKISNAVCRGLPVDMAVIYSGCAKSSYYRWKERAEKLEQLSDDKFDDLSQDDLMILKFWDAVKEAETQFISGHVNNIESHSKEQWTASAWMLERRARHLFGKVEEVQNPNQAPALVMQDSK